jgi:hypothetical protein
MISRFYLIPFFSFLLCSCQNQENHSENEMPLNLPQVVNTYSTQNVGSAKFLNGKVHNVVIFIASKHFEKEQQDEQLGYLLEAQNYLQKEAKRYGKNVTFTNSYIGYEGEPLIIKEIESGHGTGHERVDWVSFILEQLDTTPLEFYKTIIKEQKVDHVFVTIIANQPGRAYSFAYEPAFDKEKYFLEGCIQYTSFENGQKNCAASYAHEILHLFGAWDLYQTFQTSEKQEQLARKWYPKDIMLATSYDINSRMIDSLTAYLVGLHNNYNPFFDQFEPIKN